MRKGTPDDGRQWITDKEKMLEITLSDATQQIAKKLPGLSRAHAQIAAEALLKFVGENRETAKDNFLMYVEENLRGGEEWALQMAMASVRIVGE